MDVLYASLVPLAVALSVAAMIGFILRRFP